MLVILLPLAPSQCYLLKDVVQAVVPRFSTHCLLDHSYQHTNTLQYLKWNPKPLLFAMLYKPAPSFPVPLDTKLFKRILYLYRINASSVLLLSVLKNSQPQSLQILLCWILRFVLFFLDPSDLYVKPSTRPHVPLQFFSLLQSEDFYMIHLLVNFFKILHKAGPTLAF